ncbi:GNAT family N-acetyltransferase [Nisaea sediminum]|uniref:GNAT family N-acetyltransferase n=1 Tax=Nisaea sediminum TaxID=2775867 RepID=UPI0018683979|nr:GNAT family N-acetyltransferase [Nisaea sediminum]
MTDREPSLDIVCMTDLDRIMELVRAVAWPHRREDIAQFIRLGGGRIARDEKEGHALATGLWWRFGDRLARIGLVIVAPEAQGRGIGRRLVETLLEDVSPRPIVLLATEAGLPLYEKLGFAAFDRSVQYQGAYRGTPIQDPRISRVADGTVDEIADFDAAAFGARRDDMLRDLAETGSTAILTENGQISGYAMSRTFGRGTVIGPLVAATEGDALALFRTLARPGFVRIDCPADASTLIEYLQTAGLEDVGASPVMARGGWTPPSGPARIFGLASHALG